MYSWHVEATLGEIFRIGVIDFYSLLKGVVVCLFVVVFFVFVLAIVLK